MPEEVAERDVSDERREWIEARRNGIFATDTPKIFGLSRWGTPLSVYRDKMGETERHDMSLPAWIGLKMESTVAEMYTQATGQKVRADRRTVMSRLTSFPMGSHFDYRAWGKPKLLVECKTRAYMHGYGEDGTSHIPADVWAQVQHEMYVADANECHVAVLFGHHTYRTYRILRDDAWLAKAIPKLAEYWNTYIVPGVPPLPSGHEIDSEYVKESNATHDDTLKAATPEQERLISKLKQATVNVKQAEVTEAELENRIKQVIGDAAGIQGAFGTITWKKSKDSESTDFEQVAVTYGNIIEDLLDMARPGDDPTEVARLARAQSVYSNAVSLATYPKPGSRRFLKAFAEEQA